MNFKLKLAGATFAAIVAFGGAVSAATLSYVGTGQTHVVTQNNLGIGLNGTSVDFISGDMKTASNGLSLSGPANIRYTYLGYEAANTNYAASIGSGTLFTNGVSSIGSFASTTQAAAGLLDFSFGTSSPLSRIGQFFNNGGANPADSKYAIGYKMISSTAFYVLFDDIAGGDRDFDDIAMRVDVSAVPLPAAAFPLLTALAGLGFVGRRRRQRKNA